MTKKNIIKEDSQAIDFNEQLAVLTEQSSDANCEGLSELLLLLNEVFISKSAGEDSDQLFSDEDKKPLNEFFTSAAQHLKNAPDEPTINQLLNCIKNFSEQLQLEDEDLSSLSEMLFNDKTSTDCLLEDKLTEQAIEQFQQQCTDFSEQAENKQLTGLQDILFLLQDWCDSSKETITECTVKNSLLQSLSTSLSDYLSGQNGQQTVDELFTSFSFLNDYFSLEEDEVNDLKQLLLADLDETDDSGSHESELSSDGDDQINSYREQFKDFQQQAEEQELSGLQDIIFLIDEFLEDKSQQSDQSANLLNSCNEIVVAIQGYLSGNEVTTAISSLLTSINSLDPETCLLDEDDSNELKNLLQQETIQIASEITSKPSIDSTEASQPIVDERATDEADDPVQVPGYLQEYVDILSLVYLPIKTNLDKLHEMLEHQDSLSAIDDEILEELNDEYQKLTTIAETADFFGLQQSSMHMQANLPFLKDQNLLVVAETIELLNQWSNAAVSYFKRPLAKDAIQGLLIVSCSPTWPVTLEEEQVADILLKFQTLDRRAAATQAEARQKIATEEDVVLSLPDDVSAVLVDSLLDELPEQTASFSSSIEKLSHGGSIEDVTVAQRVAHTLKGAGNTVGVKGIASLTHHLEDILTALADENVLPDKAILGTLQRASDCLEEMCETLANNSPAPLDAVEVLQEILDVAVLIDEQGITSILQSSAMTEQDTSADSSATNKPIAEQVTEEDSESSEQMIRLPVSVVDKLIQNSDELTINNGQLREQLKHSVSDSKAMQAHLEQFHHFSLELLGLVDIQRIHQIQNQATSDLNEDFDSLEMDQYNELYTTSLRIHEMASDSREMNRSFTTQLRDLDNLLIEQGYLNGASQNNLVDIRTIPVQSIVSRLQRGVRQAARMSGKKVELNVSGDELLVDRDILNSVLDPLMHLLRNAVGHGIEQSDVRLQVGKPEQGNISLSFRRDRNMMAIDCIDDGAGLNLDAIKNKAISKGIISSDAELSDEELKQLIMQPNFSTEDNVSQISGRGVGMDAVNSGIRALGGNINIDTEAGKGCSFYLQLPLSLAHHNCLLINVGTQVLAIAELGIEQILLPDAGELYIENEQYLFTFDEITYAVKPIESLLSRVRPNLNIEVESRTLILLKQQDNYFAIAVESVKNVKELIVKELGKVLPNIHGVIGASLLDDGSIAPVLDCQELLQQPARWGMQSDERFVDDTEIDQAYAMVVDDSLSARRSLEQFFSDMGYQIMAARDGLDAIEQLELKTPDIIITDLEMPRINGIELTEFVRRNEATKNLPVIMITSRATAKHKQLAEEKGVNAYLTKPYSEELLSSTVLELAKGHVNV